MNRQSIIARSWLVLLLGHAGCGAADPDSPGADDNVGSSQFPGSPPSERADAGRPPGASGLQDATMPVTHTNRLIDETSPYLIQHAHNPVDWYPWGDEAFRKAKLEDKPIFLSVGYSTCYWCHVMEKESFEREDVADILNEHFVSIKVDREERPEVDEQYMLATQLVSGRGGWPNSVWLTPDGRPWMAGTYFPREQFMQVLTQLADVWKNRRDEVESQADRLAEAIERIATGQHVTAEGPLDQSLVDRAIDAFRQSFDQEHAGFGRSPKFPPHGVLRLLVHEYRRTSNAELLDMFTRTLDAMALGGVRDHVGGGFHRYSTDRQWLLPHFEKMLYDNAQLMRAYADAAAITGDGRYREVVEDIFDWLSREMSSPEGGLYSAIDSGEVGHEGEFYVWRVEEILEVLGDEDGTRFIEIYGIRKEGNFHEESTGRLTGENIPHLKKPIAAIAAERSADPEALAAELDAMRAKLFEARSRRERPHLDDKVLTSWNGLMIAALAHAGRVLEEPKYIDAAAKAAKFILTDLTRDGRLLRTYRAGTAKLPGYLDDHAYFIEGLLELHEARNDGRWLNEAKRLADVLLESFEDKEHGAFFLTSSDHDDAILRSKNILGGGNVPSGNGVAVQVLLRLGRLEGEERYLDAANRALESLSGLMWETPGGAEDLILATAMWLAAPPKDAAAAVSPRATAPRLDAEPDLSREVHPVSVSVFASHLQAQPGQTVRVALALGIAPGWHLYGDNEGVDFILPTTVSLVENPKLQAGEIIRPKPVVKDDPVLGETLATYEGRIWFLVPVRISPDAEPGALNVEFLLQTQACDETRCLPPQTTGLSLPIVIDPDAPEDEERHAEIFAAIDGGS